MTRILIAEDEVRIVSFLEKGLRAGGYTTVAVGTGPDALALARDDSFDLLRNDVNARLNAQDKRLDRQGAMGSAMMNMAINAANSRSPRGRVAAGVGWQNGESALSVGYSKALSERVSMSIGGAFSSDDRSAGLGFGVDL